jgi:hypothetical protein
MPDPEGGRTILHDGRGTSLTRRQTELARAAAEYWIDEHDGRDWMQLDEIVEEMRQLVAALDAILMR